MAEVATAHFVLLASHFPPSSGHEKQQRLPPLHFCLLTFDRCHTLNLHASHRLASPIPTPDGRVVKNTGAKNAAAKGSNGSASDSRALPVPGGHWRDAPPVVHSCAHSLSALGFAAGLMLIIAGVADGMVLTLLLTSLLFVAFNIWRYYALRHGLPACRLESTNRPLRAWPDFLSHRNGHSRLYPAGMVST
jgi:hypothetical protein